jgi:hypothetical protein
MTRRSAVLVAWSMVAAYWVLVAVGFALRAINDPAYFPADDLSWRLGYGLYPTVGAVIVARQPRNRIGWLCCAFGLLVGPAAFAQDYAWYTLIHRPGALPGGLAMGWLGSWPWYPAIMLGLIFLPLLFPNGRLASPRWRPVAWAAAVAIVAAVAWAAFAPRQLEGSPAMPMNPLGIRSAEALSDWLDPLLPMALGLLALLSAASMIVRFRRSRGEERQQLKWFTYGAALAAVMLAGIYVGAVLVLGQLFGGISEEPPSWAVAGATLVVAALFQPARRRIQAVVDRRFNRRKYDLARTIDGFGAQLRDEVDLDTLSAQLLAVVDQTLEPTKASLWLRPMHTAASHPPGQVGQ